MSKSGWKPLDRRGFLASAGAFGLLLPHIASGQPSGPIELLTTRSRMVSIPGEGAQLLSSFLAHPPISEDEGKTWPCVILVHDRWGLTDDIKATAETLAGQGFMVLAPDLYNGEVAAEPTEALFKARNLTSQTVGQVLKTWRSRLIQSEGASEKVGICGWGFGGGWALTASLATPFDATVLYYGDVERTVKQLRNLNGPVLGHFGTRDLHVNKFNVSKYAENMTKAGRIAQVYWYDASNNFAMPSGTHFDEEDRDLAWTRTLSFFEKYLGN